jgi:hypothetical protein
VPRPKTTSHRRATAHPGRIPAHLLCSFLHLGRKEYSRNLIGKNLKRFQLILGRKHDFPRKDREEPINDIIRDSPFPALVCAIAILGRKQQKQIPKGFLS